MVDAYGGGRVSETGLASGQSPFDVCPYFDRFNFTQHFDGHRRNWWVQGGARMVMLPEERAMIRNAAHARFIVR